MSRFERPVRIAAAGVSPPTGWPLHDIVASRQIEAAASQGLPEHTLMRRAGLAVARLALALAPASRRVWIAAGPGNNGGDGLEAALHLHAAGRDVAVSLLAAGAPPPEAEAALARAQAAGVRVVADAAPPWPLAPQDLAIDALLGIGASRPPSGWLLNSVRALQALSDGGTGVLAVDVPTGLDADRGRCLGPGDAVRAAWTLSLLTLKPGLFTADGRDVAGEVWFDDLGVSAEPASTTSALLTASSTDALWPRRSHAQHKGSFGDLWVVGGSPGMAGAALLAARAGLAAGAGRVYLVSLDGTLAGTPGSPELMPRAPEVLASHDTALEDATVVCGCGGGAAVAAHLPTLIGRAARLLLDADALNAVAGDASLAALLRSRRQRGRPTLLTPHPLEAARLLGVATAEVQADRLTAARTLAAHWGAVVVLKGSGSIVANPQGACRVNASGNAALASAGTGDVLAGWVGGLWSQGPDAAEAAALGVFSHGQAADRWTRDGRRMAPLPAGRLVDALIELARDR